MVGRGCCGTGGSSMPGKEVGTLAGGEVEPLSCDEPDPPPDEPDPLPAGGAEPRPGWGRGAGTDRGRGDRGAWPDAAGNGSLGMPGRSVEGVASGSAVGEGVGGGVTTGRSSGASQCKNPAGAQPLAPVAVATCTHVPWSMRAVTARISPRSTMTGGLTGL